VPVSAFAMLASVLFLAVIALHEDWPAQVRGLSPPAWAWALLREPLAPQMLAGVAPIALGLWLAARAESGRRQPAPG
jgi:drug/metabolite transporter (DMT)-like permease